MGEPRRRFPLFYCYEFPFINVFPRGGVLGGTPPKGSAAYARMCRIECIKIQKKLKIKYKYTFIKRHRKRAGRTRTPSGVVTLDYITPVDTLSKIL